RARAARSREVPHAASEEHRHDHPRPGAKRDPQGALGPLRGPRRHPRCQAAAPPSPSEAQGRCDRNEAPRSAARAEAEGWGVSHDLSAPIADVVSGGRAGPRMRVALGLGAVQLAVTLGWMGYTYFQPRILAENSLERFDSLLAGYIAAGGAMLRPLAGGLAHPPPPPPAVA